MRKTTLLLAWLVVAGTVLATPLGAASLFPERIPLEDGFRPEGIAISRGGTFYVGSIATGAIYRGSVKTGEGRTINDGATTGRSSIGIELHGGKLYVAGGMTGSGFIFSARSGRLLKTYRFTTETTTFVNDVVVARGAAYFTDSRRPFLYRVPIGDNGKGHHGHGKGHRNEATAIPLSGAIVYGEGNNANGIDKTRDGRTLIIVQTNVGKLFTVNRRTGLTREIVLDEPVVNGDGILLDGRTLYVVQNRDNKVAVIRLARRLDSGDVTAHLTDPDFDVPTTIDDFGDSLYAVNARFRPTPPPPDFDYWINRFPKVEG